MLRPSSKAMSFLCALSGIACVESAGCVWSSRGQSSYDSQSMGDALSSAASARRAPVLGLPRGVAQTDHHRTPITGMARGQSEIKSDAAGSRRDVEHRRRGQHRSRKTAISSKSEPRGLFSQMKFRPNLGPAMDYPRNRPPLESYPQAYPVSVAFLSRYGHPLFVRTSSDDRRPRCVVRGRRLRNVAELPARGVLWGVQALRCGAEEGCADEQPRDWPLGPG